MAEVNGLNSEGDPVYASSGVPATSELPILRAANQSVYYGEGAASMAYTLRHGTHRHCCIHGTLRSIP